MGQWKEKVASKLGWSFWNSPKGMIRVHWLPMSRTSIACWLRSPLKMSMFNNWSSFMDSSPRCEKLSTRGLTFQKLVKGWWKWWSAWRMKLLYAPRVKSEARSPKRTKPTQAMEARVTINTSEAKGSISFQMIRRSWWTKSHWTRRLNRTYPRSNVAIVATTDVWQRSAPS